MRNQWSSSRRGIFHWKITLPFLLWLDVVTCYSTHHKASTVIVFGEEQFVLRPYRPSDHQALAEMCKDVYGGTDDLPLKAKLLREDPTCDFLVLENQVNKDLVATGNLQKMDKETIFVEAIRVSPSYQGRGIATLWMEELVKLCENYPEILSCTIDSNEAMKTVFDKCGFEIVSCFRIPNWDWISKLPGWKATSTTEPQSILKALQLEDKISDASRNAGTWDPIWTHDELREILKTSNGIGYLPWLETPMMPSENLKDSLAKGLVRRLRNTYCVFGLVKNSQNCDLKSDYVCSIVAAEPMHFDAALWEACNEEYIPLLGGIPSFPCVFETLERQGSLQASLPVQDKIFIHYRRSKNVSN